MRDGKSPNPRNELDRGFSVPGAFKLDYLQPFKPIWLWQFSKNFTVILGAHFLSPQRVIGRCQHYCNNKTASSVYALDGTTVSKFC